MVHFPHLLIPIASDEDAYATSEALQPYLNDVERVTAVHVIEKAGGAPDKAPVAKRREDASEFLTIIESSLKDSVAVETRTVFATDIVPAFFSTATEVEADAIAFRARGGSRIKRIIAGDITTRLVTNPPLPVLSLPTSD